MHHALALAPVTLAAVLVLSGLAKLPDPRATHSMMTLLRLPRPVATATVARVVPWLELAVAVLLLTPWRWSFAVGTLAAIGLFGIFWVIVARAMTFDPRPTCGCFGRVGDHRITGRTVARNSILLALALLSAWVALEGRTGTGLLAGFRAGDWWWVLLAVALAAVAVLVLGGAPGGQVTGAPRGQRRAARERAEERAAATGADAGASGADDGPDDGVRTLVPDGFVVGGDLTTLTLRSLTSQQAQLLVLASCWCGSTVAAIERLPAWREALPQLGVQLVHTHAPWDEARLAGLPGVWWDPHGVLYAQLGSGASPAAVLLGADGLLAAGPVNGVDEIEQLVADLAEQPAGSRPA